MTQVNFDATTVEPLKGREAIPEDWYTVVISASPAVENKSKTGGFLEVTMKVTEGNYANKEIVDRLNLYHPNPVTVEIAHRKLSSYCHATGVMQIQDTQQLHGVPFKVKLGIEPGEGQYGPQNVVAIVKSLKEMAETPQAGAAQPSGAAQTFTPPGMNQQPPAMAQQQPAVQQPTQPNQAGVGWTPPANQIQQSPAQQGVQTAEVQAPASPTPPWAK